MAMRIHARSRTARTAGASCRVAAWRASDPSAIRPLAPRSCDVHVRACEMRGSPLRAPLGAHRKGPSRLGLRDRGPRSRARRQSGSESRQGTDQGGPDGQFSAGQALDSGRDRAAELRGASCGWAGQGSGGDPSARAGCGMRVLVRRACRTRPRGSALERGQQVRERDQRQPVTYWELAHPAAGVAAVQMGHPCVATPICRNRVPAV